MSNSTPEKTKRPLDFLAAATAQQITDVIGVEVKANKKGESRQVAASDVENLATKALGVLQQQGIYAMFLFLLSRSGSKTEDKEMDTEERVACEIVARLLNVLRERELVVLERACPSELKGKTVNEKKRDLLAYLVNGNPGQQSLLDNLETLFLIRDLYEQTLIYVRYGAKAAKEKVKTGAY